LVTQSLTVGEVLQCDHRRRPSAQSSVIPRILGTAAEFQAVRNAWGRPLGVTSLFRPEPINREVGGVPNSFHVQGLAMDIYPVGLPLQTLYQWLIVRWTGGFGDGRDRGFIHLDRRNGGRFVPGGGVRPAVVWRY
jgi:putative chitinase